ncbi:hypothetical protein KIN20_010923 [Parelaphostrongylus tenuis]|uniref:Uncharacterized protein n=1 Tax=Parelaphostrongylus tenuis TaxID=148309 RepID=A0AAD5M8M0_PARTN|nr:hypothetical protein KIN20_010923 [Parelaphostrongylus tenuis]
MSGTKPCDLGISSHSFFSTPPYRERAGYSSWDESRKGVKSLELETSGKATKGHPKTLE